MQIIKNNVEFVVDSGLPQYLSVEETTYQIEQVNRIKDNFGLSLIIIYKEKQGVTDEMPNL